MDGGKTCLGVCPFIKDEIHGGSQSWKIDFFKHVLIKNPKNTIRAYWVPCVCFQQRELQSDRWLLHYGPGICSNLPASSFASLPKERSSQSDSSCDLCPVGCCRSPKLSINDQTDYRSLKLHCFALVIWLVLNLFAGIDVGRRGADIRIIIVDNSPKKAVPSQHLRF